MGNYDAFRLMSLFLGILGLGSVTLCKQFLVVKEGRPPQGHVTDSEPWVRSLFIYILASRLHPCVGEWTSGKHVFEFVGARVYKIRVVFHKPVRSPITDTY